MWALWARCPAYRKHHSHTDDLELLGSTTAHKLGLARTKGLLDVLVRGCLTSAQLVSYLQEGAASRRPVVWFQEPSWLVATRP